MRANGLWSAVLSGGDDRLLRPWIIESFGAAVPKELCVAAGTRTMLEHSIERALLAAAPERVVTVLKEPHRAHLSRRPVPLPGTVLFEPIESGSGPRLLAALAAVLGRDPEAVVVTIPADHFLYPNRRFLDAIEAASDAVRARPDRPVLLGAVPEAPEADAAWIIPGRRHGGGRRGRVFDVSAYGARPGEIPASELKRAGGLMDMGVIIAKATRLWALLAGRFPGAVDSFQAVRRASGPEAEALLLRTRFFGITPFSIRRDFLANGSGDFSVIPVSGLCWSAFTRPEQIAAVLDRLGLWAGLKPIC